MTTPVPDDELLFPFEKTHIPSQYRPYYAAKRQNLFANIQDHRELWDLYMELDSIWVRILETSSVNPTVERGLPLILFMNTHAKMRVAIELAFAGCMSEARSILRDAVEFIAHAHRILGDPKLQVLWGDKLGAPDAWKKEFWDAKKDKLFAGLDELYGRWKYLSDLGAHANMEALVGRLVIRESDTDQIWRLNYFGGETGKEWVLGTFDLLLVCSAMEKTLFADLEGRLRFDAVLVDQRVRFNLRKEELRRVLIARHNVRPQKSSQASPSP
jgi:hypothetical protein